MLNWRSLFFGLVLAVVLYFMFLSFGLGSIRVLSFILAALTGGYIVGGDVKTGALHGAIIGFFGSILSLILLTLVISTYSSQQILLGNNITTAIALFIIYAAIGAVFGAIGAVLKNRALKQ
ncbi:MAG: DUF5518 domain-containing protein [Methanobacterium sp.]